MSVKKKLVVKLGSKQGADIPEYGAIYCAKAAIDYYSEAVSRFPFVVSVLNPDMIHPKDRQEGVPNRMILNRTGSLELVKDELEAAGFGAPVNGISIYERWMPVGRISGSYDPIVTSDFFRWP